MKSQMKLSAQAQQYAVSHIGKAAFPGLPCRFVSAQQPQLVLNEEVVIQFTLISPDETELLLRGTLKPYDYAERKGHQVPRFRPANTNYTPNTQNSILTVDFDIVTPAFLLLSRYEETRATQFDTMLRFRYIDSLAFHYGCIDYPLIDYYALMLREMALQKWPHLQIEKRKGKVLPTHDIDFLCRFSTPLSSWKSILGGDILRDRSLQQARNSIRQYQHFKRHPLEDPLMLGIDRLINLSAEAGLRSTFYFKGLHAGEPDATYEICSKAVEVAAKKIQHAGMSTGVHGSLTSYNNPTIFSREKALVEEITGSEASSGRQHFLRFHAASTPIVWQQSDLQHDTTLGFSEREGFRCGTCHPFPLYDIDGDHPTSTIEHPLIVMDTTLFRRFRSLKSDALAQIQLLCDECLNAEGDFVILWHNSSMYRTLESWFTEVYCTFIRSLRD